MNAPIRLDETDWIPQSIRRELLRHETEFKAAQFFEDFHRESWFGELASDLQRLCTQAGVVAYHCTREAHQGEIAKRGLRILDGGGDGHRSEFLERHADRFTHQELTFIRRKFVEVWSDGFYARGRENKLCFGLAHPRYWGSGADDLLGIYGGESVYGTFGREGSVVDKLRLIGSPAVVHFRLDLANFRGWNDHAAGQTALWAWHRTLRADVCNYWCEGYMQVAVEPAEILTVERWMPVGKSHQSKSGSRG